MPRGRSGRRPDYDWNGISGVSGALDLAEGSVALFTGNASLQASGALTLMRTHGQVFAQLDATAVDERALIAFGMIIVSDNAFAAGVGSVPAPFADIVDDWFVHGFLSVSSGAEGAVVTNPIYDRLTINSKAMRKMKNSERIVMVAETVESIDQGGSVDLLAGCRLLTAS